MKRLIFILGFTLLFAGRSLADYPVGYQSYTQWQKLPQLRIGAQSGLASSYDRTGENGDWSWYESPDGLIDTETTCTIKTIQGPGIIYRFWMPHYMARHGYVVRMYFDGESTPRIDTMSNTLLEGLFSYFNAPFVDTCAGGQVSYELIPFADSVVIETVNHNAVGFADRHYYQYTYMTYPQGIDVNSYNAALSAKDSNDRDAAAVILNNAGQNPSGINPAAIDVNIPASTADPNLTLIDVNGPGVVRQLRIKMPDANDSQLQGLNLQVFYDRKPQPAIDIPVAYFFGAGQLRADYNSLPIGADVNEGFYSYWPMPFKESIRIQLHNNTASPIDINSANIQYELKQLDQHTCYLRAIESNNNPAGPGGI
ncbi:MAG: DUF2961 domain-containing protein [Planctomycetota bacterium]